MLALDKILGVQSRAIMKYLSVGFVFSLIFVSLVLGPFVGVIIAAEPQERTLAIRQLKISGDEFVILQNYSAEDVNLSDYWLGYSSSDTATNIVPTQQLPEAVLEPGAAALLNNGSAETCDARIVASLDFSSLSDTKGTLMVRKLTNDGQISSFSTVDSVSWGKLATDAIQIANESKVPAGSNVVWYYDNSLPQAVWQVGDFKDCSLNIITILNVPAPEEPIVTWVAASSSPPSIFVSTLQVTSTGTSGVMPAANKGLKAPQLSEILPNPASPLTDAEDEFVELYNPNAAVFELSGFQLQIGSSTSSTIRSYTFPAGTKLAPLSFKAFKSEVTHLSLSNSGGQVWLVDPLDHTVVQSDAYGTAKDGQAWVLANGKWQWTTVASPDSTNKVSAPANAATKKSATVNGRTVTAVKGVTTTAASAAGTPASLQTVGQVTPVHPLTLVIVLLLALLYGAYEYRHDMANRLYQFQKY